MEDGCANSIIITDYSIYFKFFFLLMCMLMGFIVGLDK